MCGFQVGAATADDVDMAVVALLQMQWRDMRATLAGGLIILSTHDTHTQ